MNPPAYPLIALLFLLEVLFGIGFNLLAHWAQDNKIWHVSVSVCLGVGFTLAIAVALLWNYQGPFWMGGLVLLGCFAGSGIPMIAGSTSRTVKESHKRRSLPTAAMHIRDDVVMDMSASVELTVNKKMEVAALVHAMHKWITMLKGM